MRATVFIFNVHRRDLKFTDIVSNTIMVTNLNTEKMQDLQEIIKGLLKTDPDIGASGDIISSEL